jgi:hypothetical protein
MPAKPAATLEIQSDLHQTLDTRVVVPLLPTAALGKLNPLLNPTFEIEGHTSRRPTNP